MEKISGNALVVKEININLVRKVLKELGLATKQQIAQAVGLSIMTVGTVLQQLIKENEAVEAELSLSSGGRPAQLFTYNGDYGFVLILYPYEERGHIFIHSAVVNLIGKEKVEKDHAVKKVDLECFEEIIDEYLMVYPKIQAIGLGLPGAEYGGKMIISDYKALLGVSIIDYFTVRYKRPIITENDVNAAAVGFARRQGAQDETMVYLYFPEVYPPGAGILINDALYKGKRNFAGEIARLPLGISWTDPKVYASLDKVCDAIAKLTIAVSSVLNPDMVVLQGSFLKERHLTIISQQLNAELPANAVPLLELSRDFAKDYLGGMIVQTLRALEPGLALIKN